MNCEHKECNADGKFYVHDKENSFHIYCKKHYEEFIEWKSLPELEVIDE